MIHGILNWFLAKKVLSIKNPMKSISDDVTRSKKSCKKMIVYTGFHFGLIPDHDMIFFHQFSNMEW